MFQNSDFRIVVSDPWDYIGPNGDNTFTGKVFERMSKRCVLFRSNEALQFNDRKGQIFALFTRYSDDQFDGSKNSYTVNGGLLKLAEGKIDENSIEEDFLFAFIGSLERV